MTRVVTLGDLLRRNSRPVDLDDPSKEYPLVGVRWNGHGAFLRETKLGAAIQKKRHFLIREGDIVYNKLFAWKGAFAVVDKSLDGCYVSDKFPTYQLNASEVLSDYLALVFRAGRLAAQATERSVGLAAVSKFTLNPPRFNELRILVPSKERQAALVETIRQLDHEVASVRHGMRRVLVASGALVSSGVDFLTTAFPSVEMNQVGRLLRRSVTIQDDVTYRQVTIAMENRGVRLRGEKVGFRIAVKNQAVVHSGDVIFSRIDIRNGAIGVVPPDLDGAIVANDFPVFQVREGVLPEYLSLAFSSPAFREQCVAGSAGSTNRRKMKREQFLRLRIPLPPSAEQQARIVREIARVSGVAREASRSGAIADGFAENIVERLVNQLVPDSVCVN